MRQSSPSFTPPAVPKTLTTDRPSDDGPAIVAKFAEDLPVHLLNKTDDGQSSARTFGVAQSTSNLIAFLDQDEVWYPDHLAKLLSPYMARRGDQTLGWVHADLDEGMKLGIS